MRATPPGSLGSCLRATKRGILIDIHAVPGASRTAAQGLHDNALKVRIAAPPADGAANRALLGYLAELLSLPARDLVLLRGSSQRRKTVLAIDASLEELRNRLNGAEQGARTRT